PPNSDHHPVRARRCAVAGALVRAHEGARHHRDPRQAVLVGGPEPGNRSVGLVQRAGLITASTDGPGCAANLSCVIPAATLVTGDQAWPRPTRDSGANRPD